MYLSKATTTQTVTAVDQNGRPFQGDLSGVTVASDQPSFVGAALSAFADGVATLTLTRGDAGSANITIADGAVSVSEAVESYTPVLASFELGAAN